MESGGLVNHGGFGRTSKVDTGLRRQVVDTFVAQAVHTAKASGGVVQLDADLALCQSFSPHRYRNVAIPRRLIADDELPGVVDRIVDFFGSEGTWSIDSFFPLGEDLRIEFDSPEAVMVHPSGPAPEVSAPGLTVVEVEDDDEAATFERVWATAQNKPHLLEPDARRYDARIVGHGQRMWVGYFEGEPVATAASFVSGNWNLIRAVTCLASHRRRGFGRALSAKAMSASELPRFLNAHPGAEALYRSLNFAPAAVPFGYWLWRASTE